jgi:hypothetical protein
MTPDFHQRHERAIRRLLPQWRMRKVSGEGDSWDNLSVEFRGKNKTCSTPNIIQSGGMFSREETFIMRDFYVTISFFNIT